MNTSLDDTLLSELGRKLVEGSLSDPDLMRESAVGTVERILPAANVVKIGGQSLIDRGRKAVFPILDEIVANLPKHQMIIGTGAGTRARHGIPFIEPAQFPQLPLYLAERGAAIFFGMPPYTFWQQNPPVGRLPPHRTDTGAYLVSEVFGTRSMIFVKDEDGLYTADPKKDRHAKFIPRITVAELKAMDLQDQVVEPAVLDFMERAQHRRSIRVINGLVAGNLTRALEDEDVGTLITAE